MNWGNKLWYEFHYEFSSPYTTCNNDLTDDFPFLFFFAVKHNWSTMVENIQAHIGSLNWGYRVQLRQKSVNYLNSYGEFTDAHTIKVRG